MREIIFRGQRKDNKEWVEGYLVKKIDILLGIKRCFILVEGSDTDLLDGTSMTWYEVIPETIGQYIGMSDKNGKRIFTGDIVIHHYLCKVNEYSEDIGRVFYYPETFRLLRTSKLFPDDCPGIYRSCECEYEVIGNIHDTPELLE